MKNKINNENYEEVMFGLLENEFSEYEKEEIIFEIERDPLLQFEWKQFQKTIVVVELKPYEIEEVEFWKSLQKKEENPVIIKRYYFSDSFGMAASLLLLISFSLLLLRNQDTKPLDVVTMPSETSKTIVPQTSKQFENIASESKMPAHSSQLAKPFKSSKNNSNKSDPQQLSEILVTEEIKNPLEIPTKPTDKIASVVKQVKYTVTIKTEDISESEFAMMEDYDIKDLTKDEEKRMNELLANRKINISELLQNTVVHFKKKDNKIYLVAMGENNSALVLEILNY